MYAVRTTLFAAGRQPSPTALFRACPNSQPVYMPYGGDAYDTSPDGRFLILCQPRQVRLTVTLNETAVQ